MPHHPESKLNKIPPEFENNWFAQNPELLVGKQITPLLLMKKPKNNKSLKKMSAK